MLYYRKVKHYTAPSSIISMSILIDFLRYYMALGKFLIVYSYCFGWTNYGVMLHYENSFSWLIIIVISTVRRLLPEMGLPKDIYIFIYISANQLSKNLETMSTEMSNWI